MEEKNPSCGWTNPSEKYARQIGNLPQLGVKIKNVWNHHLANEWLAGKTTMNEDVYILLNFGDFPASHVSVLGAYIFLLLLVCFFPTKFIVLMYGSNPDFLQTMGLFFFWTHFLYRLYWKYLQIPPSRIYTASMAMAMAISYHSLSKF